MSNTTVINEFSLLCRLFGNLFYRLPDDAILSGLFTWLKQGGLQQQWPMSMDSQSEQAMQNLQKLANPTELITIYQALFGEQGAIATTFSGYGLSIEDFLQFRQQRGMPILERPDHIAHLLLTASWIEDNLGSTQAQQALFEQFLLPAIGKFLGKVEAFDQGFYRAAAQLCRDALAAMADELEEYQAEEENCTETASLSE